MFRRRRRHRARRILRVGALVSAPLGPLSSRDKSDTRPKKNGELNQQPVGAQPAPRCVCVLFRVALETQLIAPTVRGDNNAQRQRKGFWPISGQLLLGRHDFFFF